MPGKKIQTMKKRRTKYNKTRKGKKSGGGSGTLKKQQKMAAIREAREAKKNNIEKDEMEVLQMLDSYLNEAEEITRIQDRIKQLKASLERNERLLPKNAIVRRPSGRYGFPESKPESKSSKSVEYGFHELKPESESESDYGFPSGGGVFDRYESVSNIGRDSGSYAKPNNNVKKLVKKYKENFGLNKKSTGNYDRLNSKRKRISRRK